MDRYPRVDAVLDFVQGPRVLHLGCAGQRDLASDFHSRAWLHGRLLEQYPQTHGLEYSEKNVDVMRAAGYCSVTPGNAQDFALECKFNTIVAGELIEHLPNLTGFFTSCARHLEPGGRLVVTTPYPFSIGNVLYAWLRYPKTCSNEEHVLWLCPTTMDQVARMHGFEIESCILVNDYRRDLPSLMGRLWGYAGRLFSSVLPARLLATNLVAVLVAPSK